LVDCLKGRMTFELLIVVSVKNTVFRDLMLIAGRCALHFRGICCLCVCPRIVCCCCGSWNFARKFIPRERIPQSSVIEKLIVIQLAKKFAEFCGSQSICACHLSPSRVSSNQSTLSHRVYFWSTWNIILPSTPRFAVWSLSFRFSWQNSVFVFTRRARCNLPSDCQLMKQNVALYSPFWK